jgi:aldehyde dehydrogenase (NAD+)
MAAKGGGGGGAKSPAWYSSKDEIDAALERVRKTFDSGVTRDIEWRKRQLRAVRRMLSENEADIVAALAEDIGRPRSEALAGDYAGPVCECDEMLAHLEEWTAPEVVATPLAHMLAHSEIRSEPYGVVLVIGAWWARRGAGALGGRGRRVARDGVVVAQRRGTTRCSSW